MAEIPIYKDLEEKREFFSNGKSESFVIKTKKDLDHWFKELQEDEVKESSKDATALIYRGVTEAKYKMYTSAQRLWITNEMRQWAGSSYLQFINTLIEKAKSRPVVKEVFKLYAYSLKEREFPILSLLQHYGAPTPLLDWSYDVNVAFYCSVDGVESRTGNGDAVGNYFSMYKINKRKYPNELLNIIDIAGERTFPGFVDFMSFGDGENDPMKNGIFYISDFERYGESLFGGKGTQRLSVKSKKPYTTVFNQNIIPQKGMFIFNPFSTKSLEEVFNVPDLAEGSNLRLGPFECFNIHKDLAEYLRRKLANRRDISRSFIYPSMVDEAAKAKEDALNSLV
jgi:hypothetical protein